MKRTLLAALAVVAAACSGEPLPPADTPGTATSSAPIATSAVPAPPPAPPAFRLPDGVAPVKIAATLTLVPAEDTFRGVAELDLSIQRPTKLFWLNATELTVSEAHLTTATGEKRAARVVPGGQHFLGFAFDEEIAAGAAHLSITYAGRVSDKDDRGVFREKEGGETYLFSQFESVEARRAIPCFDEPAFKIPWQLTLRVRPSDMAISNTPGVEEKVDAEGFKAVRFAETKALPSYLVAFAVGPFEIVDAGKAGKNMTPIRFVVPRGKQGETGFAVEAAPKVLSMLEDAFGAPYPFEKLDYVVVPNLASFGAMENAGMITIAGYAALATKPEETVRQRALTVGYLAHENAHQWFGDLVTMSWWNDVWLNEGFATWMERKILSQYDAAFETDQTEAESASHTMGGDGLLSARKVRQEVEAYDDISNAFDSITYQKGSAVLRMFEQWLGPKDFQKGVRLYLDRFAWKNASSTDFLTAMTEATGKDVKASFSSFLDQPGVPIVTSSLACDATGAKLALSQERYLPIGSKGAGDASRWQIPVCARYGAGKQSGRACTLLKDAKGELPLPKLDGQKGACPEWVTLKDAGVGYFRAAYTAKDTAALLDPKKAPLTPAERMSTIYDMRALVANGRLPVGDALGRLAELLRDPNPGVQGAAAVMAFWLDKEHTPEDLRGKARAYVTKVIGPRARALGWQAKPGDSAATRKLRSVLLDAMIEMGDDPKLFAEAEKLTRKWIDGTGTIESDSTEQVLRGAASRGDKDLFDKLAKAVRAEKESRRRDRLVAAIASFRDPALVKATLGLYLDGSLDARVAIGLLWNQPRENLPLVWKFLKDNFDAMMDRAPVEVRPYMLGMAGELCDEASRADVEAFSKGKASKITGAPRVLAQSVESISLCIAMREAHASSLRAFLTKP